MGRFTTPHCYEKFIIPFYSFHMKAAKRNCKNSVFNDMKYKFEHFLFHVRFVKVDGKEFSTQ